MPRCVVLYSPACEYHDTGDIHPERPDRARRIAEYLGASAIAHELVWREPQPAPAAAIERVHSGPYRQFVEEACLSGKHTLDFGETLISDGSYEAARIAAGAAMGAVDAVLGEGFHRAFSCTRPPGHHARPEQAMGFCLFNNIAIAAEHARDAYGLERLCIVDWDVHHGNGTQEIFYGDPGVLFCSFHQAPLYPHTGHKHETGLGAGQGHTLNLPLPAGATIEAFRRGFHEELLPAVDAFQPQLILISCGFDAHREDPLGGLRLEDVDYHEMTRWLLGLAELHCGGRLVSILEGGYQAEATNRSAEQHLRALCGWHA